MRKITKFPKKVKMISKENAKKLLSILLFDSESISKYENGNLIKNEYRMILESMNINEDEITIQKLLNICDCEIHRIIVFEGKIYGLHSLRKFVHESKCPVIN